MKKSVFMNGLAKAFMAMSLAGMVASTSSCKKDESDPKPDFPAYSVTINGEDLIDEMTVKDLNGKGFINPEKSVFMSYDTLSISLQDESIEKVTMSYSNVWLKDIPVTDKDSVQYDGYASITGEKESLTIIYPCIYGTYTLKIEASNGASKSFEFTVEGKQEITTTSRYCTNKQTLIFDADKKEHSSSYANLEFISATAQSGANFKTKGKLCQLTEEKYNDYLSSKFVSTLQSESETADYKDSDKYPNTKRYFVYNYGKNYFLMQIEYITATWMEVSDPKCVITLAY